MYIIWCVAILLGVWSGCEAQSLTLQDLMPDMSYIREMVQVNYSEPDINTTYVARNEFDMRAMGPLYNSTKIIIDAIVNKQAYPENIVSVADGHVEVAPPREHWRELLAHYAGPVAFIVVATLLGLVLPLAGLFWCCCYWCRAGRRRRPFDRKYDACLKGFLAILLIGLLTLFLFGVVCAFVTESAWEAGATRAPGAVRLGAQDARSFLNATQAHARHLLVDNYRELAAKLTHTVDSGGVILTRDVAGVGGGASPTRQLEALATKLARVLDDLRDVPRLTRQLETNADELNNKMRAIRSQLMDTLKTCSQPECVKLNEKHKINELQTNIHYNKMPDVRSLISRVSAVVEGDGSHNLTAEVLGARRALAALQRDVRDALTDHTRALNDLIADTGKSLAGMADDISAAAHNASEAVGAAAKSAGDTLQRLHRQYGPYRRYVGLATAAALLLVVLLMSWGVVCGVCGKRPDVYGANDCCNKAQGSKCLLCGMGVMFVVGGGAALVLMLYFISGIAAQRFLCDPLVEPRGNRLFADLERLVDPQRTLFYDESDPDFNLTVVLVRCHTNETLYQALQLQRVWRLDQLEGALEAGAARAAQRRPAYSPPADLALLSAGARRLLAQLADAGLDEYDFDRILHALETNLTSLPLDELSAQLRNASTALARRARFSGVAARLRDAADALGAAHRDLVLPMLALTDTLTATAIRLRDGMREGLRGASLRESVRLLLDEASGLERALVSQGSDLLHNMSVQFGAEVSAVVREYVARVQHEARDHVGRCAPLSRAFNATRDAACQNILLPTNGYWVSLAWCVLVGVALLATAPRLARLYLHLDPYPGPLVEAEYLYDAYADRDNVPLANAYKAEKRSGREPRRAGGAAGGGAGGGAGEVAAAVAPPLDAHNARRYNDMAPKHWEEGPPRYHGPTEYERPPPYYYPGPHDRQ